MRVVMIRNNVMIPINGTTKKTSFLTFTNMPEEHVAIVIGEIDVTKPVMIRIHSECLTGDVFGSRRCDCGSQLNESIQKINLKGSGVILYLRQEGRGIGLYSKIDAYELQIKGFDTYTANKMLGFGEDLRTYDDAVLMLKAMHIMKVEIITNNPDKIKSLQDKGIIVTKRISTSLFSTDENSEYLRSKIELKHHTFNN